MTSGFHMGHFASGTYCATTAGRRCTCWPAVRTLSNLLGSNLNSVIKWRRELQEYGYIQTDVGGPRKYFIYTLVDAVVLPEAVTVRYRKRQRCVTGSGNLSKPTETNPIRKLKDRDRGTVGLRRPPPSSSNFPPQRAASRPSVVKLKTKAPQRPATVIEVVRYSLTQCGFKADQIDRIVANIDLRWPADNLIKRDYGYPQTEPALQAAFRFIRFNNLQWWPIERGWRAAFRGWLKECDLSGGVASVPELWQAHIGNESPLEHDT